MKKGVGLLLALLAVLAATPLRAQVKMTRDQMLFYTSEWKGDRFPDGRPKLPDSLLKRAVDISDRRCVGLSARSRIPESV